MLWNLYPVVQRICTQLFFTMSFRGFRLAAMAGMVWIGRTNMSDATIHAAGNVLERQGPVLYRVSLPNGKVILAHLSKKLSIANASFEIGDLLWLELTPYDFDQARILGVHFFRDYRILFGESPSATLAQGASPK